MSDHALAELRGRGARADQIFVPRPLDYDLTRRCLDTPRAREHLDWEVTKGLREGLDANLADANSFLQLRQRAKTLLAALTMRGIATPVH